MMRLSSLNPNYRAALVLILASVVLIAIAILTNSRDFTNATLVIAGLICLMTGIFFATISGSDPLDLRYMGLLPVQGCINLTRICADLGIQGNAIFIPKGRDGRLRTMQLLPVAEYHGEPLPQDSFVTGMDTAGLLVEPSCAPLIQILRQRDHLVIPSEMTELHRLVQELGVDVLDVAERVRSTHEDDVITIIMEDYRLISGCKALSLESPKCCIANPCPVCSLFATVFAEGTGKIIRIERCVPDTSSHKVNAVFSILHE
jgi:hypothetical protein